VKRYLVWKLERNAAKINNDKVAQCSSCFYIDVLTLHLESDCISMNAGGHAACKICSMIEVQYSKVVCSCSMF
jgi:hypothetical protein